MMGTKKAVGITYATTLGVYVESYPTDWGNCFEVRCEDGSHYKIVNFVLENLEEGIVRGKINWPITIKPISERHAVVHDPRIPDN